MAFSLPELPYAIDALEPHISKETLEYHHGKHHKKYVDTLNQIVEGDSSLAGKSLEDLIKTTEGKTFNQAAQVWNHTFYWNGLAPNAGGEPTGKVAEALTGAFGSVAEFKSQFSQVAAGHFGSGWAWLVKEDGKLSLWGGHDADNPLRVGKTPVLTCDVWEHAYYIDYRNARPKYIEAFWSLVNWKHVEENL